ncbi:MAG: hypothetical protein ABUL71_00070, partial [Gemmatimonadota bacterium]
MAVLALALFASACSDNVTLPTGPATPQPKAPSPRLVTCGTVDTAQIRALLTQTHVSRPDGGSVVGSWNNIQHSLNDLHDQAAAQSQVLTLSDILLTANRANPLPLAAGELSSLFNQMLCDVGLDPNVSDATNAWVVHVADPKMTFSTSDSASGIQFPSNAVVKNTLVTATPIPVATLTTLLDNYAAVYEFAVTPVQTLAPGTKAVIGVCPDPSVLAFVPSSQLDSVLDRLVLGHEKGVGQFELLHRVPLPPEMQLKCPNTPGENLHASLGAKVLHTLASLVLPERANAARRRGFNGGVGGSTSEFSPFGPVDPVLYLSGGVGGSTSEFVRTGAASLSATGTIDGTIGTIRHDAGLPSVTIKTLLGTPIPAIGVTFNTETPDTYRPIGNATVCGADPGTNGLGTARVTCLNFGNTAQYRTAYTKIGITLTLPDELVGVVTVEPTEQNWLVASYGPSKLVFTQPAAGRTAALGNPFIAGDFVPARVEIRSDLGDVITTATTPVTIAVNKNTFGGGAAAVTANAVAGVATFS